MYKIPLFLLCFLMFSTGYAQELNCEVMVNAEKTGSSNVSVFKTLKKSLNEFINQTEWTGKNLKPHERINCSVFININSYDGTTFSGNIQIQSSRPVYGSTMVSPVFNFKDDQFSFSYTEFESLKYNPNEYSSNLVSVVTFYIYTILGLDADTFEENGGTPFYEEANQIVGTAQQSNNSGWKSTSSGNNRFKLNADLLSNSYEGYRQALYTYHREGLDNMSKSVLDGKKGIVEALMQLESMNASRPNSLLLRTFFDAKANEIEQIFSGGPSVEVKELIEALNTMAPTFSDNWSNIRY